MVSGGPAAGRDLVGEGDNVAAGAGGLWVLSGPDLRLARRGGEDVVGGIAVGFWVGKWWRNQWLACQCHIELQEISI